ncbi:hypothetical protein AB3X91_34320 [Paraburkholderia sp. BR14263]
MDSLDPKPLPPFREPAETLVIKEFILDAMEGSAPEIPPGCDAPVEPA